MIYRLPFACATKQRPRVCRYGTFMPRAYQAWRKTAAQALHDQGAAVLTGRLRMAIRCRFRKSARGDADNYAGAVMDAANGVLYKDDKQVKELGVAILEQTGTDEVEIEIEVME